MAKVDGSNPFIRFLDSERVLALTSVSGHGKTSGVDLARTQRKTDHLFGPRAGRG
jgi:hypothetical protein